MSRYCFFSVLCGLSLALQVASLQADQRPINPQGMNVNSQRIDPQYRQMPPSEGAYSPQSNPNERENFHKGGVDWSGNRGNWDRDTWNGHENWGTNNWGRGNGEWDRSEWKGTGWSRPEGYENQNEYGGAYASPGRVGIEAGGVGAGAYANPGGIGVDVGGFNAGIGRDPSSADYYDYNYPSSY